MTRSRFTTGLLWGGCLSALWLLGCNGSCDRARPHPHQAPLADAGPARRRLDYAPFMKGSSATIAAALAETLGLTPAVGLVPDGGPPQVGARDRERYAVADGATIDVQLDRSQKPLQVHYRAAGGCLSRSRRASRALAPATANATVLALLRSLALPIDDTVQVESQLHDDGQVWIGVYVWQTYQREVIERPSVFAIVDGITSRVCEMRIPRWYTGLHDLGPPLSREALATSARASGARFVSASPPGPPALRSLRVVDDTLCREVRLAGASPSTLCLDVVTGNTTAPP